MERKSILVVLAGGAVPALLALALLGTDDDDATPAAATPASAPAAAALQPRATPAVGGVPVAATQGGASACEFEPLLAPRGQGDGLFDVKAPLAQQQRPHPEAFLEAAREAAKQGRPRDTEVALIVACRLAAAGDPRSLFLADVQGRLGQHYAQAATRLGEADAKMEALLRAQTLFARSLDTHQAVLGPSASKTRLAREQLAALARARVDGGDAGVMGAFGDRAPAVGETDFSQVESDLSRLRMQAAAVSGDPQGVQRRVEQLRMQRDAQCRGDRACLERWYARERAQLLAEFGRR